ncbi:hypothetical protein EDC01DRAFT_788532 [Geopyxis carbonaria]|nr:hypothetical protein EDC01DRAFT_788532 [Geopyxis carbonaria]
MATATHHANGGPSQFVFRHARFADIPSSIDIPVSAGDDDEDDETAVVEVDPELLPDDPTELCTLLENENSPRRFWMHIARSYAKHDKLDTAIEILTKGLHAKRKKDPSETLPIMNCLTWMYLQRSREAGKTAIGGDPNGFAAPGGTKEHYLQQATQMLNRSTQLDPHAPTNSLARGVFSIIKSATSNIAERQHHLDSAAKIFDEAIRSSRNGNMVAQMGKARVMYSRKRYDKALECYQDVLTKRPDMDPDPRIGIGMCFWQLGFRDDARHAWERVLEIDPNSKVAHILMASYYLHVGSSMNEHDPAFMNNYRKVIDHTQRAYKLDKNFPLACTTFASHFFVKKGYPQCEALAKKALDYSDVPGVTSDANYVLARKAHIEGKHELALSYYRKSDQARDLGYLPAKMGIGQIQILMKDIPSARLTFEGIVHHDPKCLEAKTVLGTLYAHEVLSAIPRSGFTASKDDVTELHKKAIVLLESVRNAWKHEKRTDPASEALLLTLARLYENDQPDKALQCLQAVEQIYTDVKENGDEVHMPLQLLNNMAVFYWHQEKYDKARELYQRALNSIPELKQRDDSVDTDALATTLTYNLARCEEAAGNDDEAKKQYEQLLQFHEDYVDANMRLAYMGLKKGSEDGVKRINKLMHTDSNNLEARALYGWYTNKQRKKQVMNIAEDNEQRHYKHSLQHHDKHDRYSLTGMGNIYLQTAREMRRDSEADKEKRRKTYEKAVEFFDKALQLDPKNAYAAQGIAIAMVEDKKDLRGAVGIFTKVRETLAKDGHAVVNLGHCLAALEQWGRAIENYETALTKFNRANDPTLLTCIGRVYYAKGKKEAKIEPEKAYESLKTSLEYAKKAAALGKENPMYLFNVAFVQSELVGQVLNLGETQCSVASMEAAAKELDESIQTFLALSKHKSPPYPPKDIEARANFSTTSRNKLERRITSQREYETRNASKLAAARAKRDAELASARATREAAEAQAAAEAARIADERRRLVEEAREYAVRRAAEEAERDEREGDLRESRRRGGGGGKGARGRKREVIESDEAESDLDGHAVPRKKKKKLVRGGGAGEGREGREGREEVRKQRGDFKSADVIVDSDEELLDEPMDGSAAAEAAAGAEEGGKSGGRGGRGGRKKARARKKVESEEESDGDVEMLSDAAAEELFGDQEPI